MKRKKIGTLKKFTAVLTREGKWYVAHCVELGVVSQGKTIEEAQANLKEAVELYLESFGTGDDIPESTGEVMLYPLEVAVNAETSCDLRQRADRTPREGWISGREAKGSHVSLQKGTYKTVVPLHDDLAKGTLLGIMKQ